MERENKVASGKKFECEERKKERKNWELGGATWTDNFASDFLRGKWSFGRKSGHSPALRLEMTQERL